MRHVAFAVALAALLCGCVPMTYIDSYPMTVHITDAVSGKPVVGAIVTYVLRDAPERRQTAQTDGAGAAALAGMSHRRWLPLLPIDYMVPDADIAVAADGYAGRSVSLGELWRSRPKPQCSGQPDCPPPPQFYMIAMTQNPR
jgi:hypothetical protein